MINQKNIIDLKQNPNELKTVVQSLLDGNLIIWIYNAFGLTVNGLDQTALNKLNTAKGEPANQTHRPFVSTLPFPRIHEVIQLEGYSTKIQPFINKILLDVEFRKQIFDFPFFCRFKVRKDLNYKPPVTKNGTIVLLLHLNTILNKMYELGLKMANGKPFILTGSSANQRGEKMAQNFDQVNPEIKKIASMLVDLRPAKFNNFMAIPMVDLTTPEPELIRKGNFPIDPIIKAIRNL